MGHAIDIFRLIDIEIIFIDNLLESLNAYRI